MAMMRHKLWACLLLSSTTLLPAAAEPNAGFMFTFECFFDPQHESKSNSTGTFSCRIQNQQQLNTSSSPQQASLIQGNKYNEFMERTFWLALIIGVSSVVVGVLGLVVNFAFGWKNHSVAKESLSVAKESHAFAVKSQSVAEQGLSNTKGSLASMPKNISSPMEPNLDIAISEMTTTNTRAHEREIHNDIEASS